MVDVALLKSHPSKLLFDHVNGVIEKTNKLTEGIGVAGLAQLAAIFHDLGKINPNFQSKLNTRKSSGYSNHAYFSAYVLYCLCLDKSNREIIKECLGGKENIQNELMALVVILAKHHGHLPDFCPQGNLEVEPYILNKGEIKNLHCFIDAELDELPIVEFVKAFGQFSRANDFTDCLKDKMVQFNFSEKFNFYEKYTRNFLDFFLDTQFAFSSLILADKTDAMNTPIIDESRAALKSFCDIYPKILANYILKFKPTSKLNILRTKIRQESIKNIETPLESGKRVFELTAPTGSGKTIMLLSLASKIIQEKGNYRIIYALPFLSITEQVEKEVLDILIGNKDFVQRIDSKSNNEKFENLQQLLDTDPKEEKIKELDFLAFQEQVFAYPFVITTFVRFFETLLSNHNATLLKLPNFSKAIFLLDEIQSLPPRLYTFFVAYLTRFCKKFDSYAIISTATQPNFELPNDTSVQRFFDDYEKPTSILTHQKYFENDVFNRYQIEYQNEDINVDQLAEKILEENKSVLVILNTIDDSKELFGILENRFASNELYLLNTHFTPFDRKRKIEIIKKRLDQNHKTILISTQLIEAGVDIDFPILYRDFALISSIVQSAGRCNRNGKIEGMGKVILFNLVKEGKSRAKLIYGRGKDKDILTFTKEAWGLEKEYQEKELLDVQKKFFLDIATKLNFAKHSQKKFGLEFDFLKDIQNCSYSKIGKFQLIDEQEYGEPRRYYVPVSENDTMFEDLLALEEEALTIARSDHKNWPAIKNVKYKIQSKLKTMSNQIVQVRLKAGDFGPILASEKDFRGLQNISYDAYSFVGGIDVKGIDCII